MLERELCKAHEHIAWLSKVAGIIIEKSAEMLQQQAKGTDANEQLGAMYQAEERAKTNEEKDLFINTYDDKRPTSIRDEKKPQNTREKKKRGIGPNSAI